jgi:hypothetical protein
MSHLGSLQAAAGLVGRAGLMSDFSYEKVIPTQYVSGARNQLKSAGWQHLIDHDQPAQ